VPILCVDLLPRRSAGAGARYLLIRRQDRVGRLGWNMVGGRIRIDEPIGDAAQRHLTETLGSKVSPLARDWTAPDLIAEYARSPGGGAPVDPDQHAVALTYVVDLDGEPVAAGEATGFAWFEAESLPAAAEFGFGQGTYVHLLVGRASSKPTATAD
jgi:ADP-ribose pyrophosphatase YjhB (NUDIX family)